MIIINYLAAAVNKTVHEHWNLLLFVFGYSVAAWCHMIVSSKRIGQPCLMALMRFINICVLLPSGGFSYTIKQLWTRGAVRIYADCFKAFLLSPHLLLGKWFVQIADSQFLSIFQFFAVHSFQVFTTNARVILHQTQKWLWGIYSHRKDKNHISTKTSRLFVPLLPPVAQNLHKNLHWAPKIPHRIFKASCHSTATLVVVPEFPNWISIKLCHFMLFTNRISYHPLLRCVFIVMHSMSILVF